MADREIIRAEIERRMKCFKNERNTITKASDNNLSLGARIAMCEEILSFINSMQEEPNILPVFDEGYWERLGEETVREDLEEAADKYESEQQEKYKDRDNHDFDNYRDGFVDGLTHTYNAFKAGAKWRKKQDQDAVKKMLSNI